MKLLVIIFLISVKVVCFGQDAVVSVSKMNFVCVCIDNQLEIAIPNIKSNKIKVSIIEGEGDLKEIGIGKYILHPNLPGYLVLNIQSDSIVSTKKLIVKKIPNPTPLLKGHMGGLISLDDIKDVTSLSCHVNNFDYKIDCKITSYNVVFKKGGKRSNTIEYKVENNVFDKNIKSFISMLQYGDEIAFNKINARCPCDTEDRFIGFMRFVIQ